MGETTLPFIHIPQQSNFLKCQPMWNALKLLESFDNELKVELIKKKVTQFSQLPYINVGLVSQNFHFSTTILNLQLYMLNINFFEHVWTKSSKMCSKHEFHQFQLMLIFNYGYYNLLQFSKRIVHIWYGKMTFEKEKRLFTIGF